MPNFLSYYVHTYTPAVVLMAMCVFHFVVELILPFGLWFESTRVPGKSFTISLELNSQTTAAIGMAGLQVGILITGFPFLCHSSCDMKTKGNYGIFNWTTAILGFSASRKTTKTFLFDISKSGRCMAISASKHCKQWKSGIAAIL